MRFKTSRIMSVRRTEQMPKSILPKTAINFYNLRKGLYIKNGAAPHAESNKRHNSTKAMSNTA